MTTAFDNPRVSVIIPVYNQGAWLAYAIESALTQTYLNKEVIVVNDGSTEVSTRQAAQPYFGRIVYIEQENGGLAAARNRAIEAAGGELIAPLDADDVWLPQKLEIEVGALKCHPHVAMVHSSYYLIDGKGERTGLEVLPEGEYRPLPNILFEVPICVTTSLFPRYILDEIGMEDPAVSGTDDWDLWLRMAARGYNFYCVSEPLAEYRRHGSNMSLNLRLDIRPALKVLDKFYSQEGLPTEALKARDQAYFTRHAAGAAAYFSVGELEASREHIQSASGYAPQSIASGRFLQSFIHAGGKQPTLKSAQGAVRFVLEALASAQLPPSIYRKAAARADIVLALHAGSKRPMYTVRAIASALARDPKLIADRNVWAAGGRLLRRRLGIFKQQLDKLAKLS
ncbi:MAG: glycosyltransferase family 2 protein [Chloroflexi bacterium]|nr:glycosyltransferase family 2 protein [Chloroflexota bacterium]